MNSTFAGLDGLGATPARAEVTGSVRAPIRTLTGKGVQIIVETAHSADEVTRTLARLCSKHTARREPNRPFWGAVSGSGFDLAQYFGHQFRGPTHGSYSFRGDVIGSSNGSQLRGVIGLSKQARTSILVMQILLACAAMAWKRLLPVCVLFDCIYLVDAFVVDPLISGRLAVKWLVSAVADALDATRLHVGS